jgi:hypothetical protein
VGNYFTPLIVENGAQALWMHHQWCEFDWSWIERFRPTEIWWMPNERLFLCKPNAHPKNMPGW